MLVGSINHVTRTYPRYQRHLQPRSRRKQTHSILAIRAIRHANIQNLLEVQCRICRFSFPRAPIARDVWDLVVAGDKPTAGVCCHVGTISAGEEVRESGEEDEQESADGKDFGVDDAEGHGGGWMEWWYTRGMC